MLKVSPKAQHQLLFRTVWNMDQCLSARFKLLFNSTSLTLKLDYLTKSDTYILRSEDGKLIKQSELLVVLAYLDGLEEGLLASCSTQ